VQVSEKALKPLQHTETVHLPAPTAWPMVLALGITLCAAGLVTSAVIFVLGLVLAVMAAVGWFRQVLPHEHHELVKVQVAAQPVVAAPVARVALHHQIEPIPTYSFIAGIEGGLAGGAAMAAPAVLFSWVKFHSFWYAINLLAAGGFVGWNDASDSFLGEFHLQGLVAAVGIHLIVSVLVGLLYGAMLPMFPRRRYLTAGVLAPVLWSGLAYGVMNSISPILSGRVDWYWFIPSQVAFGLVAGFVVNLRIQSHKEEFQALPFAQRAGLHTDEGRRGQNGPDGGGQ